MEDQKNLLLAVVLSTLVMIGYWFFFAKPMAEQARKEAAQAAQMAPVEATAPKAAPLVSRDVLVHEGQRIPIDTKSLSGSFLVQGSRFDDISLKEYAQTLEPDSPDVVLLTPEGADHASYVFDNWVLPGDNSGATTPWRIVSGDKLTETTPIVLQYDGQGFEVTRTISADEYFLITLEDKVTNTSGQELSLTRKGFARQHSLPPDLTNFFILQEGPISIVDGKLHDMKYKKLKKEGDAEFTGEGGWAGLTDKYWLTATIAPQGKPITSEFNYKLINNIEVYEAGYSLNPVTLTQGASIDSTGYVFAGAKDRTLLMSYQKDVGISEMERAIDWGILRPLTRPMSWALSKMGGWFGNFGIAILALTLVIKLFMFPLFNKQYQSQAKMKKVQPKMKKLQELYGDDRMKLQQEMMAMYRKEGVNPMSGCLPIIPTMFVFFALYKTVFINVDLRHAPFYGYIHDLSGRDPLSVLNGFGLLPWDAVPLAAMSFLAIGPLALLYGITMYMMQLLTPATTMGDPMQQRIFKLMPWLFMFIMAPFATGLLLYWVWNNILSFAQQYYITRKNGVETPIDNFFKKLFGRKKIEAAKSAED